jgi:oxalate decarboxylase/phosphoglucose isomerase-like protein (cupin superfamily)
MIVKKIHENLGVEDGTIRFLGIWDTILERGAAVTPHVHKDVEEVYYILEGNGEMRVGDEAKLVEAGDVIYIPPEKVHTIIQVGEEPLRFITASVDIAGTVGRPSAPSYVT